MNSIGDKNIGFKYEAGAEDLTDISGAGELGLGLSQDTDIDQETDPDDLEYDGAGEIGDAIRSLEEAELPVEEEPAPGAIVSRQSAPSCFFCCIAITKFSRLYFYLGRACK